MNNFVVIFQVKFIFVEKFFCDDEMNLQMSEKETHGWWERAYNALIFTQIVSNHEFKREISKVLQTFRVFLRLEEII